MAPDAEKLRQRKAVEDAITTTEPSTIPSSSESRICRLQDLRSTEVCIDGLIYSLEGFNHPGGDSILVFGGNDVSVQYRMIHAYHTAKHLEKMKCVGKVTDYVTE